MQGKWKLAQTLKKFLPCLLLALLSDVLNAQESNKTVVAVSEISNLLTIPPAVPGRYNRFLSEFSDIELLFMPPVRVDAVIGYLVDMRGVADYLHIPHPAYIENAPVFSLR